ncbi:MAG: hypothetical protein MJE66_06320 [Proteobacteria bacterium]|nr:hypothetical protein [Pseudomonadota bacterium]
MRIAALSLLALVSLGGCLSLHADVPEDAVRRHMAHEEGVDLGAICSHEGRSFSEGALVCMADRRMTCDPTGRWVQDDAC